MPEPVVTVNYTIMDGTVVRWYREAETARPLVSASRNGVMIHGDVLWSDLDPSWLMAAEDAHKRLRSDRAADVSAMATHEQSGPYGPLVPVKRESPDA